MNFLMFFMVVLIINSLIYSTTLFMNWKIATMREKSTPYECGFDPNSNARVPFSLRFFILIIMFLVFDIEVMLLTPIPLLSKKLNPTTYLIPLILFLIILTLGLLHEWHEGSLDWMT